MTPVIRVRGLTKRYGTETVLRAMDLDIEANKIYGLLGRNGAGKTTLMSILTAQNFATAGEIEVFGENPYENPRVLQRMCFVREGQKYPDNSTAAHAFAMARMFFPHWDQHLADELTDEFRLPLRTRIKKLSRGQASAVGAIIGLASRAEITFFDEPYLGLDAVARQIFYDRLLTDYAEHPRTMVLSSHLIDEVANLIERVLVIDDGAVLLNEESDTIRDRAFTVVGNEQVVTAFVAGREELHRERLGRVVSATVLGRLGDHERRELTEAGLDVGSVSLQQLIVRLTARSDLAASGTVTKTQEALR